MPIISLWHGNMRALCSICNLRATLCLMRQTWLPVSKRALSGKLHAGIITKGLRKLFSSEILVEFATLHFLDLCHC
jgi:hypothetical protein